MNTPTQYDEVGRSKEWQANIWTGDHATRYIFDNGYMVSLLWGEGSYGSMNEFGHATSYEVAVFTPSRDYLRLTEWDDVIGDRSWDTVKHILEKINANEARSLELTY
jgi:phage gpG-like protein